MTIEQGAVEQWALQEVIQATRRVRQWRCYQTVVLLAAGGGVWCGDETSVVEFLPLRAAWSRTAARQVVVISERTAAA
jgi:hypothetical protein